MHADFNNSRFNCGDELDSYDYGGGPTPVPLAGFLAYLSTRVLSSAAGGMVVVLLLRGRWILNLVLLSTGSKHVLVLDIGCSDGRCFY